MILHRSILVPAIVLLAGAGCDSGFPGTPPPGTCSAGEKVCYTEVVSGRDYVLRCNNGEVQGAIWLIDEVCLDGQICNIDQCLDPGAAP